MTNLNQQIGELGERLARKHLEAAGYTVVTANWRCAYGEIDIVAQRGDILALVEVRTRRTATTEAAFASITPAKREKMARAAHAYLSEHHISQAIHPRIDVIAVALPGNSAPIIQHMEDALGW